MWLIRGWTCTVHGLQLHCDLNLSSDLLDGYQYWIVWRNGTSGFARHERTLRNKSESLAQTNNFEGKRNTLSARCGQLHIGCGATAHHEYFVRACYHREWKCAPSTNLWNNIFLQANLLNVTGSNKLQYNSLRPCRPCITAESKSALFSILNKHSELFSAGAETLGCTNLIYHMIDIGDSGLCVETYGVFPTSKTECSKQRWTNCKALLMEPSSTPFTIPTILVTKNGNWRSCITTANSTR